MTEKIAKKHKIWQRVLAVVCAIVALLGVVAATLCITVAVFRNNYFTEVPQNVTLANATETQPLVAVGRGVYDSNGNRVKLQGVNFGNWLLQEGWMSVNSLGAATNADGSFVKINEEGIVEEYVETYQEEVDKALQENPNLTAQQVEELWNVYYDNFIQEEDFVNVKNLGLNTIRLPMYYRNFMEGDDEHLQMKPNAFARIDWFLEMCQKYDLYAILDLHGVVGGQSGYEHSGSRKMDFWDNELYQQEMCTLWENIARHYVEDRPDLSATIAAYDLVNEPTKRTKPQTGRQQLDVMNKLYQAVRKVDSKHIISIECCWMFNAFPNPARYGWENVMYQIHLYNWNSDSLPYDLFYWAQDLTFAAHAYDVPYFVGEFTFFSNQNEWAKWLDKYDERSWNWTIWNYKCVSVGWWDNSWGVYVYKMNLKNQQLKLDLRTATYDEIYQVWSHVGTSDSFNSTGVTYEVLKNYTSK